jgi:hypothetical protein
MKTYKWSDVQPLKQITWHDLEADDRLRLVYSSVNNDSYHGLTALFSYNKDAGTDVGSHGEDTLVVVHDEPEYVAIVDSQRVIIGYLTREVALRSGQHIAKKADIAGTYDGVQGRTLKTFLAHERKLAARAEAQDRA